MRTEACPITRGESSRCESHQTPGLGELRSYSNSSAYEEAECVDPTGSVVYVERDLEYSGVEPGALDIWRLGLDDGGWQRITHFNRYAPFHASNPTVSSDGARLAFQLSIDGDTEGQGDGILVNDFAAARVE